MNTENPINPIEDVDDGTEQKVPQSHMPAWMDSTPIDVPHVPSVPYIPEQPVSTVDDTVVDIVDEPVAEEPPLDANLEFTNEDGTPAKPKSTIDDILASIYDSANSKTVDTTSPDDLKYTVSLSTNQEVFDRMVQEGHNLGPEIMVEEMNTSGTHMHALRTAVEYFNSAVKLMMSYLENSANTIENTDKTLSDVMQRNVEGIGVTTAKGIPSNVTKNKVISGKDALITVASIMQGVKRIPLWNSGFYITLKAPSIKDIISYYNTVSVDGYDFGRENGAYYFMYADYRLKKHVLEDLLPKCLVGSNYKHWQNNKRLIKAISLQDYDVIIWAIASMIYREGAPVRVVCAEPDCNYSEEVNADLSKMRFVDTGKITTEAIAMMKSTEVKSNTDLIKYIEALGFPDVYKFKTLQKATGEYTYWCFDLVPANCADYLEQGDMLHSDLLKENSAPTEDDVVSFFSINHYRSFIPWIANIKCISEEGYNADVVTDNHVIFTIRSSDLSNKEVLNHILDITQMETTDFPEYIEKYASRTKITMLAYYMGQCPVCKKTPSHSVQGFIPYDMQMHFFMMSLMRILKTA